MQPGSRIYVAGHRGLAGSAIIRKLQALGYDNLIVRSHAEVDPLRRELLEIPLGGMERGESPKDTPNAEVREEIGGIIRHIEPIGFVHGMTYLFDGGAHLYFAELDSVGAPQIG